MTAGAPLTGVGTAGLLAYLLGHGLEMDALFMLVGVLLAKGLRRRTRPHGR